MEQSCSNWCVCEDAGNPKMQPLASSSELLKADPLLLFFSASMDFQLFHTLKIINSPVACESPSVDPM